MNNLSDAFRRGSRECSSRRRPAGARRRHDDVHRYTTAGSGRQTVRGSSPGKGFARGVDFRSERWVTVGTPDLRAPRPSLSCRRCSTRSAGRSGVPPGFRSAAPGRRRPRGRRERRPTVRGTLPRPTTEFEQRPPTTGGSPDFDQGQSRMPDSGVLGRETQLVGIRSRAVAGWTLPDSNRSRFTRSARSWQGPNPEATLVTAHCRSQNEWALPDSNQRSPGVPFRGRAARLLPTEI